MKERKEMEWGPKRCFNPTVTLCWVCGVLSHRLTSPFFNHPYNDTWSSPATSDGDTRNS
ncbi:hypothetical protein Csa_017090 [Cucumis sativus]|uniref:Uncharacterized protein n=1 Tax=Cucumis sativus TaxID=3659 RepID=A0A0A0K7Z9_CUCSA|nr:hypothetical protein Csa_017090 [Cucumis sativus]